MSEDMREDMRGEAPPIDAYLEGLDPEDRAVVSRAYGVAGSVVAEAGVGATQGRSYGMPALMYQGKPVLSVMRAKKHVGVYPYSGAVIAELFDVLDGVDHSSGAVRFPLGAPVPERVLRALVACRMAEIDARLGE